MDNKHEILELLRAVAAGRTAPEDALLELKTEPFADLGYAKVDFHRGVRQGAAEDVTEGPRAHAAGQHLLPAGLAGHVLYLQKAGVSFLGGVQPPGDFPAELVHRVHLVQPAAGEGDVPHLGQTVLPAVAGGHHDAVAQHKGLKSLAAVGRGDALHRLGDTENLRPAGHKDFSRQRHRFKHQLVLLGLHGPPSL